MNSKKHLLAEAERLYVYELVTLEGIATRLNLNRKTPMQWKDEYDWENKRKKFLKSKQTLHHELYEFARKLMNGISADIESGEKIEPSRMYAFCKILPMFVKVKDYEDCMTQKDSKKNQNRGLTADIVAQIEEDILGITHNDESTEEK